MLYRSNFTSASDGVGDSYVKNVKKAQTSLANLLDTLIELRVNMVNQVKSTDTS